MARTRRTIPIAEKIEAQQQKVDRLQAKLDKEKAKLDNLQQQKDKVGKKELVDLMLNSGKTAEEIKAFLEG